MGLLELLQAGNVDAFNEARGDHGRIELFAEDLAGLVLKGVDLSGAVLDKSDLTGSDLTDANLVRASLDEIDGGEMILDGVLGMQVRLRDAFLEDADLTGADFSNGDLTGATLTGTRGEGIRLLGAKLKDVVARDAHWSLADLSEAVLKGADFSGADLTKAKLTDTRAGGARFEGARLDGVDAVGLKLGGARCARASFVGARLAGAQLTDTDLTDADLRGADLSRANLTGAKLEGADLRGAVLADAVMERVDLSSVKLEGADLTGVDAGSLGLRPEDLAALAGHGARFDPEAPLFFEDAWPAVRGTSVAAVWLNPDADHAPTLRWACWTAGEFRTGVLPVNGPSVLFHAAAAVPDGFRLIAMLDRPDGAVLVSWPLVDGVVGAATTTSLGYDPAVLPVLDVDDDGVVLWGLARRGPTIVVHRDRLDGHGFRPVASDARPQARGFVGRTQPVLLCKGGVAMTVQPGGLGPPRRTPEGFPSRVCTAAPMRDGIVAVWSVPPVGKDPGGLRWMDLGARHAEPAPLGHGGAVLSLDAVPDGDGVVVAWTEEDEEAGSRAFWARLPEGRTVAAEFGDDPVEGIRLVRDTAGGAVLLAATTLDGALHVRALDGVEVAILRDPKA